MCWETTCMYYSISCLASKANSLSFQQKLKSSISGSLCTSSRSSYTRYTYVEGNDWWLCDRHNFLVRSRIDWVWAGGQRESLPFDDDFSNSSSSNAPNDFFTVVACRGKIREGSITRGFFNLSTVGTWPHEAHRGVFQELKSCYIVVLFLYYISKSMNEWIKPCNNTRLKRHQVDQTWSQKGDDDWGFWCFITATREFTPITCVLNALSYYFIKSYNASSWRRCVE